MIQRTFLLIVLLVAFTITTSGCDATGEVSKANRPHAIKTTVISDEPQTKRLVFASVTRSTDRADLGFLSPGDLSSRPVELGQRVAKDQTLAILDNPSLKPAVRAAQQKVYELKERGSQLDRDIARYEDLSARQATSKDQLEQLKSQRAQTRSALEAAKADLDAAKAMLERATMKAPFAGTITAIHAEPGDYINPGQTILSIAGDHLEIPLQIPPRVAQQMPMGTSFELLFPFNRELSATARVTESSPANEHGELVKMTLELDAGSQAISQGLAVDVLVPIQLPPTLLVSVDAVFDPGTGKARVFRVTDDSRVHTVAVKVLGLVGSNMQIASDELSGGDRVAMGRLGQLHDGVQVEITQ
ncbi:MAG: RND transporter [Lysobacteraceae bacterium]|nr:MAG: RND transporter [Xanthomonadaceae bacterium]